MKSSRYIYVVLVKGGSNDNKTKWVKCAFYTRIHAAKWIQRMQEKEISLTDIARIEYRIKQIILHSFGDPRLKKKNESI